MIGRAEIKYTYDRYEKSNTSIVNVFERRTSCHYYLYLLKIYTAGAISKRDIASEKGVPARKRS